MTRSFRSYIELDEYVTNGSVGDSSCQLEPALLPGEKVVAAADDMLLYLPLSDQPEGVRGRLTVTNFRLAFRPAKQDKTRAPQERSLLLGQQDVCLANVDTVHQLLSSGGKVKLLQPRATIAAKIKGLQIRCKDFRLFTFSFNLSSVNEDVAVTNALLWQCYPRSVGQLFAFHYREEVSCDPAAAASDDLGSPADWQAELTRTGCLGWRVSLANEMYQMCRSLPESIVVPKSLFDSDLTTASGHFLERRPPVWCWGRSTGAAIVRSAYTHPDLRHSAEERRMLDSIRACHPFLREPSVLDVGAACPSVDELQESYTKLRQLCSPESVQSFVETDGRFLGLLNSCGWMYAVSRCLAAALDCVEILSRGAVCVLTESSGRDLTAAVSSLAQLLLEPSCRTQAGFERLVQREWLLLGHPFQERLGLVHSPDGKKGPVFLLFLDCVHQLVVQYPERFEFTETYLVSLWDSLFVSLFDTFIFNCQKEREDAAAGKELLCAPLPCRSVWQWRRQFPGSELELFTSPLYAARSELSCKTDISGRLRPLTALPWLRLWTLAYCRWSPSLHAERGGAPAELAHQRRLVERLRALQARAAAAREGVLVRRPAPRPPPPPLPGSLSPFAAPGTPSRLLYVPSGFVSNLLRGSVFAGDDDETGTLRRQKYGS